MERKKYVSPKMANPNLKMIQKWAITGPEPTQNDSESFGND